MDIVMHGTRPINTEMSLSASLFHVTRYLCSKRMDDLPWATMSVQRVRSVSESSAQIHTGHHHQYFATVSHIARPLTKEHIDRASTNGNHVHFLDCPSSTTIRKLHRLQEEREVHIAIRCEDCGDVQHGDEINGPAAERALNSGQGDWLGFCTVVTDKSCHAKLSVIAIEPERSRIRFIGVIRKHYLRSSVFASVRNLRVLTKPRLPQMTVMMALITNSHLHPARP